MFGRIFLKNDQLLFEYGMENVGESGGSHFKLGTGLTNFLEQEIEEFDKIFKTLLILNINSSEKFGDDDVAFGHELSHLIDDIDGDCIYLHVYVQVFLQYMLHYFTNKEDAMIFLRSFATDAYPIRTQNDDYEYTYKILTDSFRKSYARNFLNAMIEQKKSWQLSTNPAHIPDSTFFAYVEAKDMLLQDISKKQKRIKKELDFITTEKNNFKEITPTQRLYLLDYKRYFNGGLPYYIDSRFRLEFLPLPTIPTNLKSINDIKKFMLENNVKIFPAYEVNFFEDIVTFELFQVVSNNILIKKCENCGNYFIPSGRCDTKYCDKIRRGQQKPCNVVGPAQKYRNNNKNQIHTAYEKAYKKNYSRVRNNAMSQSDFLLWSDKASKMRDDCRAGKISFEEFQNWLNQKV